MTATLDVINAGLGAAGLDPISSLDETGASARRARVVWPISRQALLRRYRWAFATQRVILPADETAPAHGFAYQHPLPTDCLTVVSVGDGEDVGKVNYAGQYVNYRLENGPQTRAVHCDFTPVYLVYTRDEEDMSRADPMFIRALELDLGAQFCLHPANDPTRANALKAEMREAILAARRAASIEQKSDDYYIDAWLGSRWLSTPEGPNRYWTDPFVPGGGF